MFDFLLKSSLLFLFWVITIVFLIVRTINLSDIRDYENPSQVCVGCLNSDLLRMLSLT